MTYNRPSTKIVGAPLMLASAIVILAIAWGERGSPGAAVGGPDFGLIGPGNRICTRASFASDAVLVIYFGFTTCWRACPTALNTIAQAVDDLGPAGERIHPIFVSLDPQREDPETVDLYLKGFGDRFTALRRSEDQVRAAAAEFGVSIQSIRYSADPADYAMVHSSPVVVLIPGQRDPVIVQPDSSSDEIRAVLVGALDPGRQVEYAVRGGVQNRLCRCDVSRSKAFSIPTIYWRQQIICCPYPAFVVP